MDCDDITEYSFAQMYFEGFEHWEMVANAEWMLPLVTQWRKELELRMKSKALLRMREMAESGSKESFAANKYLLDKGWKDKEHTRGRPSKDEIKAETNRMALEAAELHADLERIQLN
jgi:hypothetical protein